MNRNTFARIAVLLLAVVSLALSGCGGDDGVDQSVHDMALADLGAAEMAAAEAEAEAEAEAAAKAAAEAEAAAAIAEAAAAELAQSQAETEAALSAAAAKLNGFGFTIRHSSSWPTTAAGLPSCRACWMDLARRLVLAGRQGPDQPRGRGRGRVPP